MRYLTQRNVLLLWTMGGSLSMATALYIQHVMGIEPCPMCIVQRYCLIVSIMGALVALMTSIRSIKVTSLGLIYLGSGMGAFTAARQSWLQWHPPEVASCGRDFYGMIEAFPLQRVIPMLFKGSGDCSKIDFTFLGLSTANLSFLFFVGAMLMLTFVTFFARPKASP